ncbi:MAG TPA: heavy metal-binding domain-containing protein [Bryobacteraceae bacterium]|nr:heavy metal-binding domain-containing protein [Bryobacteraceae bacterium]
MSMCTRRLAVAALFGGAAAISYGQEQVFVCPMDPDVRSNTEGVCEKCGMKLVSGIPDLAEYALDLKVTPPAPKVNQPTDFEFVVRDPWKDRPVKKFQIVHEQLFHLFVVSQDMKFFVHDHPDYQEDGSFRYKMALPKSGMYRILGDFYPDGATPQLITKTVFVPGAPPEPVQLSKDYSLKKSENMEVELETDPPQPIAHTKTMMFFKIKNAEGLEKLLGAWGHMLAASDDLIDMIHTHPFLADGGPNIQFNVIFPRAHNYRVWVQFQRLGVVNTVYFDVPVEDLH